MKPNPCLIKLPSIDFSVICSQTFLGFTIQKIEGESKFKAKKKNWGAGFKLLETSFV
jgi:hypothetical protein